MLKEFDVILINCFIIIFLVNITVLYVFIQIQAIYFKLTNLNFQLNSAF